MPLVTPADIRILVIEDDPLLAVHIQSYLQNRGYSVTLCHNGEEGLQLALDGLFDLILMDIMLPERSGLEVLQHLREDHGVPVMLMSALGAEQNRIAGFSEGADDYLPKPFTLDELGVRVDAIMRRVAYERSGQAAPLSAAELQFEPAGSDVLHEGVAAGLTPSEYRVLELLWQNMGEALSKAFLYQQALNRSYSRHDRSLDMHVSQVRRKLQAIGYSGTRLETVWGKGYMLVRR